MELIQQLNTVLDCNDFDKVKVITNHDQSLQKEVLRVKSIHQTILLQMTYLIQKAIMLHSRKNKECLTIGFIGIGSLGKMLVNSLLVNGKDNLYKVIISLDNDEQSIKDYKQMKVESMDSKEVINQADVIVMCFNNRMQNDQLFQMQQCLIHNNQKMFVSMLSDLSYNKFAQLTNNDKVAFVHSNVNYSKMDELETLLIEQDNAQFMDNLRNNKIEKLICSHLVSTVKPMEIVQIYTQVFDMECNLYSFVKENENIQQKDDISELQISNIFQNDFITQLRNFYAQFKHN